jgi:ferrous iron transport protein A
MASRPLDNAHAAASPPSLATLQKGEQARVTALRETDARTATRMLELGFAPGECVRVVACAPGGFPIAVRVGVSTFALREREARLVEVALEHAERPA